MEPILCEHKPSPMKLDVMGVFDWPLWKKGVSSFPWTCERRETCYFLRGRAVVTPAGGAPQEFRRGDLVTFPVGTYAWEVLEPVQKHYSFD